MDIFLLRDFWLFVDLLALETEQFWDIDSWGFFKILPQPFTYDLDIKFKVKNFNCRFSEDSTMKTILIEDTKKTRKEISQQMKAFAAKPNDLSLLEGESWLLEVSFDFQKCPLAYVPHLHK